MFTMIVLETIFVLCLTVSVVQGFAAPKTLPQEAAGNAQFLSRLANSASTTLLDLKLDVGSNDHYHMCLQGLVFELSGQTAVESLLPDGNGSGAGAKNIVILDEAHFIGMTGKQNVPLKQGCWELIWRDNAGSGVIIFGFLLEERVQRNNASLDMGRIYMSFPVWTNRGLKRQQEYQRMIEAQAKIHSEEKLDAFKKMDATRNVIQKARHFRRGVEANEKLALVNTDSVAMIPRVGDVMALGKDIQIITRGTVWTREEVSPSFFGGQSSIRHTLLGTASIRPGSSVKNTVAP